MGLTVVSLTVEYTPTESWDGQAMLAGTVNNIIHEQSLLSALNELSGNRFC